MNTPGSIVALAVDFTHILKSVSGTVLRYDNASMPTGDAASARISHFLKDGEQIDVAEGQVRLDTMNWGALVELLPFEEPPEITLAPYSQPTFDEVAPSPKPEVLNVTNDGFALEIHKSTSAGLWKWRATGKLLKPVAQNTTPPLPSPTNEKKWSRGDKIAAISLGVMILLGAVAFVAAVAVPELRIWLHLDKSKPPAIVVPSSTK